MIIRLAVGVPTSRVWSAMFGTSFAALAHRMGKAGIKGHDLQRFELMSRLNVSLLPNARQQILQDAIDGGFTHLLFLDDDMHFPYSLAERLINHDVGVVGVNYVKKTPVQSPTSVGLDGKSVQSKGRKGLEKVAIIPTGLMMINLEAIKHIPRPHFAIPYIQEKGACIGEDIFFCERCRQNGVDIYVDHDLSQEVSHCGEYMYSYQTTFTGS